MGDDPHRLPAGWDRVVLRDVVAALSGGTPSRSVKDYYGGAIPWVKSGELNQDAILATEEHLTENGLKNSSAKWVPQGTPLVAMYGATAGRCAWLDIDATINQAILAVRAKSAEVDNRFLFYCLRGATTQLLSVLQGSGQGNLSADLILGLEVDLPGPAEQRRIAEILTAVDDAIEATRAVIGQTRRLKTALLQDLLTHGLPGRRTQFREVRLGDVFSERKEKGAAGLPVMSVTMAGGLVERDALDRRVESALNPEQHSLVRAGDIAYNMMRMWQGVFGLAEQDCLVSPAYVVVTPQHGIRPLYASFLFEHPHTIHQFHLYSQGVVDDRLRLYFDQFKSIRLRIVAEEGEQQRIAGTLRALDIRIEAQAAELDSVTHVKSALSQALLTGRVRVSGAGSPSRTPQVPSP